MPIAIFPEYQQTCKICDRQMDQPANLRALIDETREEWMSNNRRPERTTRGREQMKDAAVKYREIHSALYETLQFADATLFTCCRQLLVAARANTRMMLDRFMAVQHIAEQGLASWEIYQYKRGIENLKAYQHDFADFVIKELEDRLARLATQGNVASTYKPKGEKWYPQYTDLSRFGVHFEMGAHGDQNSHHYGQLVGVAHFCVCSIRAYIELAWKEYLEHI